MGLPDEYIKQLERQSSIGERLEFFMSSGGFDLLDEYILKPLEREAFEEFTKLPPAEVNEIIQTQQAWKAIQNIRRRISSVIAEGKMARENLKTLPEKSDE